MLLFLLMYCCTEISGCSTMVPLIEQEPELKVSCKAAYSDLEELETVGGARRTSVLDNLLSALGYSYRIPRKLQMGVRIINGVKTSRNEVPYQVALFAEQESGPAYLCGAILISDNYVITAAHCVTEPLQFSVRVGTLFHSRGGQVRGVARVVVHPEYSPDTNDFDVAALRLAPPPLALSADLQPAQLASSADDAPDGATGVASGWGTIDPKTVNMSASLLKVHVPILSESQCVNAYGPAISKRMLCAGYLDGSHDACQGDSGGPLAVGRKVVGIVSWGYGCAHEGCPGVFTNVSSVRGWIREVTGI